MKAKTRGAQPQVRDEGAEAAPSGVRTEGSVHASAGPVNDPLIDPLIDALWSLREAMRAREQAIKPRLIDVDPSRRASAANLAHFLAMREVDLRGLQERLARLGVSSLGRAETHVLANLDKVLGLLHRLAGRPWTPLSPDEPAGFGGGGALLARQAERLFGRAMAERGTRIMVTLPSEAAHDEHLIGGLVAAGMDIARINCAHDGPAEWTAMAALVRHAGRKAGRKVRILMDLGGPKLRTGPVQSAPGIVRIKARRDAYGRAQAPARLGLRPPGSSTVLAEAERMLEVDGAWLARLEPGQIVDSLDPRASRRRWRVARRVDDSVCLESPRGAYLTHETRLRCRVAGGGAESTPLATIVDAAGAVQLSRGQRLYLTAEGMGRSAPRAASARAGRPAPAARIACTLPEVLPCIRKGERIWFDDGRIGGVVVRGGRRRVEIEITDARDGGDKLAADKGINLPDTRLNLPALTAKDLEDLQTVAKTADMVGLSFAQSAADVAELRRRLAELGAGALGVVLKIETRRGFERLPEMLLAAMSGPMSGVMIARGDLAVECGYERMAEVQEEILWACEAAHTPVVWATQVLETLAKTGRPSRAEITDAAMGGRAECVMLNKGPHIVDAIRTLDDILRRMQAHQAKKRPLLRALKAWREPAAPAG